MASTNQRVAFLAVPKRREGRIHRFRTINQNNGFSTAMFRMSLSCSSSQLSNYLNRINDRQILNVRNRAEISFAAVWADIASNTSCLCSSILSPLI
jgi:hypothetical protein